MSEMEQLAPHIARWRQRALIVGGAGLAACLMGFFVAREQFFRAYLMGFVFVLGLALGCFAFLMLHHMVGGGWGFVIQRLLESGTRTLPLLAALFVPLALGVHSLYEWSHADVVAKDEILKHKSVYLSTNFFYGRAIFYFAVWMILSSQLNKWSAKLDETKDNQIIRRLQYLSGMGLLLYGLTVTFAAVDWVMSLEPHWFSTMYGLLFIIGQGVTVLAFVVLMLTLLSQHEPYAGIVRPQHFHDYGNLMFAFVMLWAYTAFSQFLIIWTGNLPEENVWYLHRMTGGWQFFASFLLLFHWAVPFTVLLSRKTKRSGQTLALVAAGLILMRLADLYWLIAPAFHGEHSEASGVWLFLAAP
ncbi:MAG: hypothetical protein HY046_07185, partial [Acidobacteria bacterium]|nr:hypothetical protein [Acidobacteriota bacterium]